MGLKEDKKEDKLLLSLERARAKLMRKRILYITLARVTEAKVNAGGTLYYSLTRESEVLKAQAPYDKGGEVNTSASWEVSSRDVVEEVSEISIDLLVMREVRKGGEVNTWVAVAGNMHQDVGRYLLEGLSRNDVEPGGIVMEFSYLYWGAGRNKHRYITLK